MWIKAYPCWNIRDDGYWKWPKKCLCGNRKKKKEEKLGFRASIESQARIIPPLLTGFMVVAWTPSSSRLEQRAAGTPHGAPLSLPYPLGGPEALAPQALWLLQPGAPQGARPSTPEPCFGDDARARGWRHGSGGGAGDVTAAPPLPAAACRPL